MALCYQYGWTKDEYLDHSPEELAAAAWVVRKAHEA
jgi:hypothetical protein